MSRREHSKLELHTKLIRAGYEADEVEQAIAAVGDYGWQSDERFAQSLARRRSGSYGKRLISAELKQHEIDGASVSEAINALQDEPERALYWVQKRYGHYPHDAERDEQQALIAKIFRLLIARGFTSDDIKKAMTRWREFDE